MRHGTTNAMYLVVQGLEEVLQLHFRANRQSPATEGHQPFPHERLNFF